MRAREGLPVDAAIERALATLGWEGSQVEVEDTFLRRLLGFTVRPMMTRDRQPLVLAFPRCRSVHTCFMRFPLDIAFVSGEGEVLLLASNVGPWRFVCAEGELVLERATCFSPPFDVDGATSS